VTPSGPETSPAGRGTEFRGKRVATNSMIVIVGQVLFTAIGLVTTPVTLSHVGVVEFGLWTIITSAVGYITVVDPGFGDMVTRYGARAHLAGDRVLGARLGSLATLFWLGIGVVFIPLLLWAVPLYVGHLHLHPGLDSVAENYFYWGYAITVAGSLVAIMSSRLTAIGDQWLVTTIDTVTRLVYCAMLLALLFRGYKLNALVVATSAQIAITFLATCFFVLRRAGALYGNPFRLHGGLVREVVRFGGWLQLGGALEALTYETDPLVIGAVVGVKRATPYGIGQRVARQSTYFAFIAQTSILPAISAAYAANEGLAAIRRMYERANRMVVLLGCVIGGAVLGMAPVIIAAWFGRAYLFADGATCLAVIALMIGLPRPATAAVIMAMGRVGIGVRAQFLAFAINLPLTLLLVRPMGMFGVMLATVIAKLVATAYLLVTFHRLVEGSARELLFSWLNKLLLAIFMAAGAARLALGLLPISVVHDRIPALGALAALGALYVVVFSVVLRVTRYFKSDDLVWFSQILPGPIGRVVARPAVRRLAGTA